MKTSLASVLFLGLLLTACRQERAATAPAGHVVLHLGSAAFEPEGVIPSKYTCAGANVSPPLSWGPVPADTRSLALIVEKEEESRAAGAEPDAGTVLWMVFNIAPDAGGLTEGLQREQNGAGEAGHLIQGRNHQGTIGYTGPCPSVGDPGRYAFRLYALSTTLPPEAGLTRQHLFRAMNAYILAEGEFTGIYAY